MKNLSVLTLLLLFGVANAQTIKGKSNEIPFKGAAVVAEEKRVEAERKRLQDERRRAEEQRLENERIALAKKEEEERRNAERVTALTLETLGLNREHLPKYYALIIGVSNYKNASLDLPNLEQPVKDAKDLTEVLRTNYTFEDERIYYLADPSRSEVISALENLAEVVTEKDNVLVFYAGHGVWDKSKDFGYWLAADADPKDKSTWIPNSTLKDYLGAIKSKHTLLIADACFSGSIFKTRNIEATNMILKFRELYKDKSRRAMTSGNLSTVPDKSVFIEFLLKKLAENDHVFMSSRLLFSRMFEPISNNTPIEPQFGVIQGVGDEGGDFIFIKKK